MAVHHAGMSVQINTGRSFEKGPSRLTHLCERYETLIKKRRYMWCARVRAFLSVGK